MFQRFYGFWFLAALEGFEDFTGSRTLIVGPWVCPLVRLRPLSKSDHYKSLTLSDSDSSDSSDFSDCSDSSDSRDSSDSSDRSDSSDSSESSDSSDSNTFFLATNFFHTKL